MENINMKKRNYTEFIIMRHGQSTADVEKPKRFEGSVDNPLTKKGKEQARLAGLWIAEHCPPQRIISSPLIRAEETARVIAEKIDVDIEIDERLQERKNGILGGLTEAEADAKDLLPLSKYKPDETAPKGESLIELRARAETFWSKMLNQSKAGQRILIVSHGQMIAMLFRCLLNLPTDESIRFATDDTGIHSWQLDEKGWKIVFTNSREHLQKMTK